MRVYRHPACGALQQLLIPPFSGPQLAPTPLALPPGLFLMDPHLRCAPVCGEHTALRPAAAGALCSRQLGGRCCVAPACCMCGSCWSSSMALQPFCATALHSATLSASSCSVIAVPQRAHAAQPQEHRPAAQGEGSGTAWMCRPEQAVCKAAMHAAAAPTPRSCMHRPYDMLSWPPASP